MPSARRLFVNLRLLTLPSTLSPPHSSPVSARGAPHGSPSRPTSSRESARVPAARREPGTSPRALAEKLYCRHRARRGISDLRLGRRARMPPIAISGRPCQRSAAEVELNAGLDRALCTRSVLSYSLSSLQLQLQRAASNAAEFVQQQNIYLCGPIATRIYPAMAIFCALYFYPVILGATAIDLAYYAGALSSSQRTILRGPEPSHEHCSARRPPPSRGALLRDWPYNDVLPRHLPVPPYLQSPLAASRRSVFRLAQTRSHTPIPCERPQASNLTAPTFWLPSSFIPPVAAMSNAVIVG
ncbi:hypothetical protein BC628DRAFT_916064 [Trametes gibbosa]|nr:hypothetical protein BC628DRAFT_916064 [Trametes gibbosa]